MEVGKSIFFKLIISLWKMNMILRNILAIFFITRPFITFCIKNVALVIYDEDLRDVNQTYINNNLSAIDSNTQANYYTLKKTNSSYQKVLNSSMVEMLKKNDFVISFLSGKESQILHEILDAYDARHFSLSPEDCHLVSLYFCFISLQENSLIRRGLR